MKHKHSWKMVDSHYIHWCEKCGTLRYTQYINPVVIDNTTTSYSHAYKYYKPQLLKGYRT